MMFSKKNCATIIDATLPSDNFSRLRKNVLETL